jgi:thiamine-phosphate pyrophosphorylase
MIDLSIYLVTDSGISARAGHTVADVVTAAVRGGATSVQIREKDAPAAEFLALVIEVAQALPDHVSLIVNDRVDVFLAARAAGARVAGVHVGQSDLPARSTRDLIGPDAILGVSAATPTELEAASDPEAGVDYVGIGAVHATTTKPDAPSPLGVDRFAELVASTPLPAVAIGGIGLDDIGPLRRAGAAGVAVVSGICAADDPEAAARDLARLWGDAR